MAVSSSYPDEQPADAFPHLLKLFEQDKVVLEAVQKRFDEEGWDLPEISVRADAAALNFARKWQPWSKEETPAPCSESPAERLALTEYTENVRTVSRKLRMESGHEPGALRRRQPWRNRRRLPPLREAGLVARRRHR